MPSRQEKKRAKRREKYLQVRDDVLESARASYKADPEKKRTAEREGYHADQQRSRPLNSSGIMQTRKRNGQLNAKAMHMTLAETLRQRCLLSVAWFEYSSAMTYM